MCVCESEKLSSGIKVQMFKELLNDIIIYKMNKQLKIIIAYVKYLNATSFLLNFTCLYT